MNRIRMKRPRLSRRRGSVLPLVAVSLVALVGLVALAVDVGRLAVAKVDCQNAADAAAIAGARSLDSAQNLSAATADATNAATASTVLGVPLQASEISVSHGSYHYDSSAKTFSPQIPAISPDNYNLTQVTITHQVTNTFAKVFGKALTTITATATAAHRPRDIAIVLDYSGSMNNESDLWNDETYLGSANNSPNNTDPLFPQFGPYDPSFSANATLQCTSSDPRVGFCNTTQAVQGVPAMVNDFYQNNFGSSGQAAFTSAGNTVSAPIAGDNYLKKSGTWILTWSDYNTPSTTFFPGYSSFKGYTQGPAYWGKTFFIWPPQPTSDWRKLYFLNSTGAAAVNDDRMLWDSGGNWQDPSGNYRINYKAILAWIKTSPNPFPSQLRAGHILFYSAIPTDVPASAYDHTQPNSAITNPDQRFWKEYIDFVVGVWRDPFGNIQRPGNSSCSYGPDFVAGSGASKPVKISGPDYKYVSSYSAFIDPADNPQRPRVRLWFGPMTMIQYMSDTGLLPGTTHDVSMIAAKLGVNGALLDIENNHPNDMVSLIMFSRPGFSGEPAGAGQFSVPRVTLGNDYAGMINALWYPNNSGSADVRPWDANDQTTPRAHGDYTGNTATDYGFMLAYNQFSCSSSLVSSGMGGLGRKGAQKIVILETDGLANTSTSASVTNSGAYQSYYNVGPLGSYSPSGTDPATSCEAIATRICALDTDTSGLPGFAQPQRPVLIHCIGFGAVFEPTASGSEPANAVAFLQQLSTIGGTVFPSSASDPTNGYKWCIGTLSQRQTKLQQAFTNILDNTESIILVK